MLCVKGLKALGLSCGKIILFIRPIIRFYLVLVCFSSCAVCFLCSCGRDARDFPFMDARDFPFMCEGVVTQRVKVGGIRAAAIKKKFKKI